MVEDWDRKERTNNSDEARASALLAPARLGLLADCLVLHFTRQGDKPEVRMPDHMPLKWAFVVTLSRATLLLTNPSTDQAYTLTADDATLSRIVRDVTARVDALTGEAEGADSSAFWVLLSTSNPDISLNDGKTTWRSRLLRISGSLMSAFDDAQSAVPVFTLNFDKTTIVTSNTSRSMMTIESAARGQTISLLASHRNLLAIKATVEHRVHALTLQERASATRSPAKIAQATTSKLSDVIKRQVAGPTACKHFCGGKACKYEHYERWGKEGAAITGVYSNWYGAWL